MSYTLQKAIEHLEVRKRDAEARVRKIASLIEDLRNLNGLPSSAIPEEAMPGAEEISPPIRRHRTPGPKAFVTTKSKGAFRYKYQEVTPLTFSIDYIKKVGREVPAHELFDAYCAMGGYPRVNRKRYYPRFYQHIHAAALKRQGLTQRVEHTPPAKRKAIFNVDSAILLQKEKTLSAPDAPIVDINKY